MMKGMILAAALVTAQPAPSQSPTVAPQREARVAAEARGFMESYANDLVAGDRAGVAERYDRRGAYVVVGGTARLESYADIARIYAGPQWSALPRFQWHDLMYVPAGPDSVVVAGRFSLQPDAAPSPIFYSYSNLLVRQHGRLRIRVEHETREPAPR